MNKEIISVGEYEDTRVDEELQEMLREMKVRIKIIGLGGGGCNTVARLYEEGIVGAELYVLNTDAQHLLTLSVPKKILLGRKSTKGLGAGAMPQLGEAAAKEAEDELKKILEGSHIAFLTCGLGGGTGTGAIPYVARLAKDLGILTIVFTTLPFRGEGRVRMENAAYGLKQLRNYADTVVTVPNDKLLELVPRLPLNKAFKVADDVLGNSIKSITETITKPGMVNLDLNDVKTVMEKGGAAMIGIGESSTPGDNRAMEAVQEAINSPLLDAELNTASGVLVNVVGPTDMSVGESQRIMDLVQTKVNSKARIIWGSNVDPKLDAEHLLRVILIVTGVNPKLSLEETPSYPVEFVK